jgi:hypothetical protein
VSASENASRKLEGLEERGFRNPAKLISRSPDIVDRSFEDFDRNIRMLYVVHGDRSKVIHVIETSPALLTYNLPNLLLALHRSDPDPKQLRRRLINVMPNLYIKSQEKNNQFTIGGGTPGGQVSWQMTGIRHDAYILANPIIVRVLKTNASHRSKGASASGLPSVNNSLPSRVRQNP